MAKSSSGATNGLSEMGPQYVSINTVQGRKDCIRLFPDGFKNADSDVEEDDDSDRHRMRNHLDNDVNQNAPIDRHMLAQDSEDNTLEGLEII